jgi:hypothetical protein
MKAPAGTFRRRAIQGLVTVMAMVPAVMAQQPSPRIGYVYPAGGRQATTFQVTVGGQLLETVTDAYISGGGVEATVIDHSKPLTPQQFNTLRDQLKELMQKKAAAGKIPGHGRASSSTQPAWTADDDKTVADIRKKLANPPKRQGNPAIAETVTLEVTVAADAEPGERELRLSAPLGLTNPLMFCVGQLPEFSKKDSKDGDDPLNVKALRNRNEQSAAPPTEMNITIPATVNGQILPGGVDRFRFKARKGQRLVVVVAARQLIPYLPDAVPGWFQAALTLYDGKGKELAYDDDYRFHPDPVLSFEIPRPGEYMIEIKDAVYRGREDFVYRISIGELPFITGIFPLGGKVGVDTSVELKGWNLPVTSLTQPGGKMPGLAQLSVRQKDLLSNRVPFAVDSLPDCLEQEPNNRPDTAQPVKLPIIVNGRIATSADRDVFRFEGHAGEEVVAEVYARRLDSPLDSTLKLTDAAGRQLAFNDDREDKGTGLNTHHADSWLRATLPADGSYYVQLADAQDKGGAEYAYRLRISAPKPDFELRVVPSSINVRGGATVPLTVHALRKDGFSGEITLALKNAPKGFALAGARVPASQDQARITLTAPRTPLKEPLNLSLEGYATIAGVKVVRPAVPAEDMMQAFAYRHLVPAKDLLVSVPGRWIQRNAVKLLSPTPVKIPTGGTATMLVTLPMNTYLGQIQLELSEPPDGITIKSVSPSGEGTEIVLNSDAAKVKPGLRGNLIVNAFVDRTPASGKEKAQANKRRVPAGSLPAIPFEVVAK